MQFIKTVSSDSAFVKLHQCWHTWLSPGLYEFLFCCNLWRTHCIWGATTVMLFMIKVIMGCDMSQHCSQWSQTLVSQLFPPLIALKPLCTVSTWLFIFHCCGHLTCKDGWREKGGKGKRATVLSKASLRYTGQISVLKPSNIGCKVPHPTRY